MGRATAIPPQHLPTPERVEYARRIVAAEHRSVPLSDGMISDHTADCPARGEDWYDRYGASDAPDDATPEVIAAYYGPPCQTPEWITAGICPKCTDDNDGHPVAWPCYYAMAVLDPEPSS